jgi:hypothetical protein
MSDGGSPSPPAGTVPPKPKTPEEKAMEDAQAKFDKKINQVFKYTNDKNMFDVVIKSIRDAKFSNAKGNILFKPINYSDIKVKENECKSHLSQMMSYLLEDKMKTVGEQLLFRGLFEREKGQARSLLAIATETIQLMFDDRCVWKLKGAINSGADLAKELDAGTFDVYSKDAYLLETRHTIKTCVAYLIIICHIFACVGGKRFKERMLQPVRIVIKDLFFAQEIDSARMMAFAAEKVGKTDWTNMSNFNGAAIAWPLQHKYSQENNDRIYFKLIEDDSDQMILDVDFSTGAIMRASEIYNSDSLNVFFTVVQGKKKGKRYKIDITNENDIKTIVLSLFSFYVAFAEQNEEIITKTNKMNDLAGMFIKNTKKTSLGHVINYGTLNGKYGDKKVDISFSSDMKKEAKKILEMT